MDVNAVVDRNIYGAIEVNGLVNGPEYHDIPRRPVEWTEPGLVITRFRMISDPGFPVWDVSYCHGRIGDEDVDVILPFSQLPKRGWRRAIVAAAKADGVYAKGTGIFDAVSTLV